MTVVFKGIMEKRTKGCNCKGKKSEWTFVAYKSYILPSGITKTFRKGRPEEVSDEDGEFLLMYEAFEKA